MNPEEYYEYNGDFTFRVDGGKRGPVLRFLREDKIVTEIHLSRTGAQALGVALLEENLMNIWDFILVTVGVVSLCGIAVAVESVSDELARIRSILEEPFPDLD